MKDPMAAYRAKPDTLESLEIEHTKVPEVPMLASGGWCAPSEVIYYVGDIDCHVLDLPALAIRRGGISHV